MKCGEIIYLNGASSSGKTSLARALQQVLDEPYFHLSIDTFATMRPQRDHAGLAFSGDVLGPKMNRAFVACIAAFAATGTNVIVDDVLCESFRHDGQQDAFGGLDLLKQRVHLLAPYPVLYVAVRCALPELQRREAARSDRAVGLTTFQYDRVHRYSTYDVDVDTSTVPPEDCALRIREVLHHRPQPTAFQRMQHSTYWRTLPD